MSVIFQIDFYDPIQNTLQDIEVTDFVFSTMRPYEKTPIDSNIILVNNGYLNRKFFAKEIEILNSYNPKVIGIDAFFRKAKSAELDTPLVNAFSKVKNLVLVSKLDKPNEFTSGFDTMETSHPMFNQYATNGFANVITDEETNFRTVRELTPTEKLKNKTVINFSIEVAKQFDSNKAEKFLRRANDKEVINYRRNIDKYITLDVEDVFKRRDSLQFIKDKIVLIGFLGPDLKTPVTEDIFYTPLNKQYAGKTDPDMYGVVIHANTISMILNEDYIYSFPSWFPTVLLVIVVYLNMLILSFFRRYFEFWYQTLSIFITAFQLITLILINLYSLHLFSIQLKLSIAYPAILLCVGVFEAYHDSLKPLFQELMRRIKLVFRLSKHI